MTVADRLARAERGDRARQPPVLSPGGLPRPLDQGGGRRLPRQDQGQALGPRIRRRGQRACRRAAVRARALGHRVLGRLARLLAGTAVHDAARPALPADRVQVQSAAHLDAAGHDRHGRHVDRDLPGRHARRLPDLRPHAGADLGHKQRFPVFSESICCSSPATGSSSSRSASRSSSTSRRRSADGTYPYNLVEYQRFSVRNYKSWIADARPNQRF